MATQQLGDMGPGESEPVPIEWRWYYNVPSLALWGLLLLLTVVPKHNWSLQAWLILLLPLAVAGFFVVVQLLIPDSSEFDAFGGFVTALAIAWTSVWLVGQWLGSGNPVRASLIALGVMFGVGLVGYFGFYGFWFSSDVTWPMFGFWATGCIPLVVSTLLTGICCRGKCSAQRLLFWPILWLPVTCVASIAVFVVALALAESGEGFSGTEILFMYFLSALVISPFVAGALYMMNFPVLMLCIFTPCYRERFRQTFCQASHDSPTGTGSSPFQSRANDEPRPGGTGRAGATPRNEPPTTPA